MAGKTQPPVLSPMGRRMTEQSLADVEMALERIKRAVLIAAWVKDAKLHRRTISNGAKLLIMREEIRWELGMESSWRPDRET